jgi:hypothetical protein
VGLHARLAHRSSVLAGARHVSSRNRAPWPASCATLRCAELGYFYNACNQIATQSALLAGFCYSGLTYLTYVDGDICERSCSELTYPLAVTLAMCAPTSARAGSRLRLLRGHACDLIADAPAHLLRRGFSMLALWQATLAAMFAPGLALRGPPGSMDMAVNQLMEEYQGAMRLFVLSLFFFMTTAILWCARRGAAAAVPGSRSRAHTATLPAPPACAGPGLSTRGSSPPSGPC